MKQLQLLQPDPDPDPPIEAKAPLDEKTIAQVVVLMARALLAAIRETDGTSHER